MLQVEKKIVSCRTRLLSLLIPDNLGAWSAIRLDHPVPLFLVGSGTHPVTPSCARGSLRSKASCFASSTHAAYTTV